MAYIDRLETERLVLRRFVPEDWVALKAYGLSRDSIEFDRWENWPTDEPGAKGAADYFATSYNWWAVARKADGQWVGFVTFNEVTDEGHLDMGHGFIPTGDAGGEMGEAIRRMVEYAFLLPGIRAVEARNPEDWAEQIAPVVALGFEPFERGRILRKRL